MPQVVDCKITAHQEVGRGHYRMALRAPDIASDASPGQFCMIEVRPGYHPFLRRPMSIERIFADGISVLYKVEGEGTRLLSTLAAGQSVSLQGPLGKPFPVDAKWERPILVSGGIGVAPFPGLAESIIGKTGHVPEVVLAARNDSLIMCEKDFKRMGCRVTLATDDGSAGRKGFASEALAELAPGPGAVVYACGPMAMMYAVHEVCVACGVPCYASLEAFMACGDGVCMGCVVEANVEIEAERMVRVCADGPVFDTTIIDWTAQRARTGGRT